MQELNMVEVDEVGGGFIAEAVAIATLPVSAPVAALVIGIAVGACVLAYYQSKQN